MDSRPLGQPAGAGWSPDEVDTLTLPRLHAQPEPQRTLILPRIGRVIALVPARNEADSIGKTVAALYAQEHLPDRVVVVTNNCTDDGQTRQRAEMAGAEVIDRGMDPNKKAGALNYALEKILPDLNDDDFVMIQDGDTLLNEEFIAAALAAMNPRMGGVCARYDCPNPRNVLERLQAAEFARSRRLISRKGGRVKILVGIATLFSVRTIRAVIEAREMGILPGGEATFYNNGSVCEDYELTLALLTLGYKIASPAACRPKTDAMPTVGKLWHQRVRWSRGGWDDLKLYGFSYVTSPYYMAQLGRMLAMLSPVVFGAYLLSLQITFGHIVWDLPWVLVNVIFLVERVVTVREAGIKSMVLSALLLPELLYEWFMAATYVTGLVKHLRGAAAQWKET